MKKDYKKLELDKILDLFAKTRNNQEFVNMVKKIKWL